MKSMYVVAATCVMALGSWGCLESTDTCDSTQLPPRNGDRVTVQQGVWGDVWFWEGDFMPMCPSGTVLPVGREIHIHTLTSGDQVEWADAYHTPFFTAVLTPEVARVWSDKFGFFQASLPVGHYSMFVVEDSLLYANGGDGYGNIYPFDVLADEMTEIRFDITYRSYY